MAQQATPRKRTAAKAPERKPKRPATFDHLQKKGKPRLRVPICTDEDAAAEVERLTSAHADALLQLGGLREGSQLAADTETRVSALYDQLEAAKREAEPYIEWLTFESIGRKRYDTLVDDHPPTDDQVEEAKEQGAVRAYNPDTFLPALISESCIEPQLSIEQVQVLFDEWNNAEVMALIQAALAVNTARRSVTDWGNG